MLKEFPVEQLKIKSVFYEFTQTIEDEQDAEFEIRVDFESIKVEGEALEPSIEFLGFSSPQLEEAVFTKGVRFTDTDELEPASIYFQHVHNPIDLKAFKITKGEATETIELTLHFDFDYEATDYKSQSRFFVFELKKE